ncbi:MAG: peptide deformylase [Candidatus Gastranaerophilales bacterium]|nr:peptide deformylase [Candidatus Gastranaerophilales bacterium]
MTIRKIVKYGEPSLREKSKEVHKMSKKVQTLIDDMFDTMYAKNGVGLAASQLGENLRIFVIDTSTGRQKLRPMVFVNPKIIKKSGALDSLEGCLSFPEAYTNVRRYSYIMIKALDKKGRPFVLEVEAEKDLLLTKAIQHEFDHLDGVLFIDRARNRFAADKELIDHGLPPIDVDFLIEDEELEKAVVATGKVEKFEDD